MSAPHSPEGPVSQPWRPPDPHNAWLREHLHSRPANHGGNSALSDGAFRNRIGMWAFAIDSLHLEKRRDVIPNDDEPT